MINKKENIYKDVRLKGSLTGTYRCVWQSGKDCCKVKRMVRTRDCKEALGGEV